MIPNRNETLGDVFAEPKGVAGHRYKTVVSSRAGNINREAFGRSLVKSWKSSAAVVMNQFPFFNYTGGRRRVRLPP